MLKNINAVKVYINEIGNGMVSMKMESNSLSIVKDDNIMKIYLDLSWYLKLKDKDSVSGLLITKKLLKSFFYTVSENDI